MRKIACLFPGQGAQYFGMGLELYDKSKVFKETYDLVNKCVDFDLLELISNRENNALHDTAYAQTCTLAFSVAMFNYYYQEQKAIPFPHYMMGHSLGEYSALVCSGSLTLTDAAAIVRKRGELMSRCQDENTGMMAITGAFQHHDRKKIIDAVSKLDGVSLAAYNSKFQMVISGLNHEMEQVIELLDDSKFEAKKLKISIAAHSSFMEPIVDEFTSFLAGFDFKEPKCRVISNYHAAEFSGDIKSLLIKQLVNPVLWSQSLYRLNRSGVKYCIDIGPRNKLLDINEDKSTLYYSLDSDQPEQTFKEDLLKDIEFISTPITTSIKTAICTKNNNSDVDGYAKSVLPLIEDLMGLQTEIEKGKRFPEIKDYEKAQSLLVKILEGKTENGKVVNHIEMEKDFFPMTFYRN